MITTDSQPRYNIEVLRRGGAWVATDDRALCYSAARDAMRAWSARGCSARMIAVAEGRAPQEISQEAPRAMLAALREFAKLPADAPPPGIMPGAWSWAIDAARAAVKHADGVS